MKTSPTRFASLIPILILVFFSSAYADPMNYQGVWNTAKTYAPGSVVKYSNATYYSLKSSSSAPNKNKIPASQPSWWQIIAGDTAALTTRVKALEIANTALKSQVISLNELVTTLQHGIVPGLYSK